MSLSGDTLEVVRRPSNPPFAVRGGIGSSSRPRISARVHEVRPGQFEMRAYNDRFMDRRSVWSVADGRHVTDSGAFALGCVDGCLAVDPHVPSRGDSTTAGAGRDGAGLLLAGPGERPAVRPGARPPDRPPHPLRPSRRPGRVGAGLAILAARACHLPPGGRACRPGTDRAARARGPARPLALHRRPGEGGPTPGRSVRDVPARRPSPGVGRDGLPRLRGLAAGRPARLPGLQRAPVALAGAVRPRAPDPPDPTPGVGDRAGVPADGRQHGREPGPPLPDAAPGRRRVDPPPGERGRRLVPPRLVVSRPDARRLARRLAAVLGPQLRHVVGERADRLRPAQPDLPAPDGPLRRVLRRQAHRRPDVADRLRHGPDQQLPLDQPGRFRRRLPDDRRHGGRPALQGPPPGRRDPGPPPPGPPPRLGRPPPPAARLRRRQPRLGEHDQRPGRHDPGHPGRQGVRPGTPRGRAIRPRRRPRRPAERPGQHRLGVLRPVAGPADPGRPDRRLGRRRLDGLLPGASRSAC